MRWEIYYVHHAAVWPYAICRYAIRQASGGWGKYRQTDRQIDRYIGTELLRITAVQQHSRHQEFLVGGGAIAQEVWGTEVRQWSPGAKPLRPPEAETI